MIWQRLLQRYRTQSLFFLLSWVLALVFSMEFVLSVSMIALIVLSVFQWQSPQQGFPIQLRSGLGDRLRAFIRRPDFVAVTIPFFLVLLTLPYSSDWGYGLERLRIKLPFLLLPFAFFSLPPLSRRQANGLLYAFVGLASLAALITGIRYGLNFEYITEQMKKGQHIPTPGNHIRFSLMLAFAVLTGAILWARRYTWRYAWERHLIGLMTVFLFLFIHVLSVRSGLLVLYLSIAFMALRYIWVKRRWGPGLAALALLVLLPVLAYQFIPSFYSKVNYARYDLEMYFKGEGATYSDSERLVSLGVGWQVVKEQPWLGVGAGDLRAEVYRRFEEQHPEIEHPKMPHNQLLTIWAGCGLWGLVVFLGAFVVPLWYRRRYGSALFASLHLIVFISYMMENTIENAVGVAFYLLFLLLGMVVLE
ncbi:MAG: O-antigen ligase family protein [Bacteroidota bacterium]